MKICTFREPGGALACGIVIGGQVVSVAAAARQAGIGIEPASLDVIALAGTDRTELAAAADDLVDAVGRPIDSLELGPPVPDPDKIICLGLNYSSHAEEAGLPLPEAPILFSKHRAALVGHEGHVVPPRGDHAIDYEAELALVIGTTVKDVAVEDAMECVWGYMPFNDVSARDLQLKTSQWMAGKSIDTFAPCGPCLTSADEVPGAEDLQIRARVNGDVLQDSRTSEMIFSMAEQVSFISSLMTLLPGDIIATGTPAGVGASRDPQVLLGHGDVVEIEIEGLGVLRNTVNGAS